MFALGFLIPLAVLGVIAWVVVGFTKARGTEPFTLATATALYSRVMLIIGVLMSLTGLGIVLKAAFAFINLGYSYNQPDYSSKGASFGAPPGFVPSGPPAGYFEQLRSQDLVLGITVLVVGILVAVAHYFLARAVSNMSGGSPGWVTRGTVLGLAVTTAVVGILSAAIGLYSLLSFFIVGASPNQQPWGDPLGLAITFVPAWVIVMVRLVCDLRHPAPMARTGAQGGIAAFNSPAVLSSAPVDQD